MQDWFKKSVSILVLSLFTVNTCFADIAGMGIEFSAKPETPQLIQIDIPAQLASVEEFWEAPARPNPKMILQIQNAHTNYEAQSKIRDLMSYLNQNYGFKTIFVEGASEELNPDYLKLFPDAETNKKLWDELAKRGQITGADWFLLNDEKSGAKGVGIENAELYKKNYEALKAVYSRESETAKFVGGLESELDKLATKTLPTETRKIISEWKKFEKGHREFIPFVESLAKLAKQAINLDLKALYSQIEWPQVTRILVLQEMEKKLQTRAAESERQVMLDWMKKSNVSKELIVGLERFNEKDINMNRIRASSGKMESLPRFFVEKLVEEAGPKGLKFSDYPNFALYTGYLILRYEIEPTALFEEIRKLFEKLLEPRTTEQEPSRKLIELFKDAELIRKLLNLELSRGEWGTVLARKAEIEPARIFERVKNVAEGSKSTDQGAKSLTEYQKQIHMAFESAFSFYDLAIQRDDVFYEKMAKALETTDRAILMTGGFHTEGLREIFREKEISYGTITPRLTQVEKSNLYREVMLGKSSAKITEPKTTTVEVISRLMSLQNQQGQGASLGETARDLADALNQIAKSDERQAVISEINRLFGPQGFSAALLANDRISIAYRGKQAEAIVRSESRIPNLATEAEFDAKAINPELFQKANEAFSAGEYDQAIVAYYQFLEKLKSLLTSGISSITLGEAEQAARKNLKLAILGKLSLFPAGEEKVLYVFHGHKTIQPVITNGIIAHKEKLGYRGGDGYYTTTYPHSALGYAGYTFDPASLVAFPNVYQSPVDPAVVIVAIRGYDEATIPKIDFDALSQEASRRSIVEERDGKEILEELITEQIGDAPAYKLIYKMSDGSEGEILDGGGDEVVIRDPSILNSNNMIVVSPEKILSPEAMNVLGVPSPKNANVPAELKVDMTTFPKMALSESRVEQVPAGYVRITSENPLDKGARLLDPETGRRYVVSTAGDWKTAKARRVWGRTEILVSDIPGLLHDFRYDPTITQPNKYGILFGVVVAAAMLVSLVAILWVNQLSPPKAPDIQSAPVQQEGVQPSSDAKEEKPTKNIKQEDGGKKRQMDGPVLIAARSESRGIAEASRKVFTALGKQVYQTSSNLFTMRELSSGPEADAYMRGMYFRAGFAAVGFLSLAALAFSSLSVLAAIGIFLSVGGMIQLLPYFFGKIEGSLKQSRSELVSIEELNESARQSVSRSESRFLSTKNLVALSGLMTLVAIADFIALQGDKEQRNRPPRIAQVNGMGWSAEVPAGFTAAISDTGLALAGQRKGLVYVLANTNLFREINGRLVPNGLLRVAGEDLYSFNRNTKGLGEAKALFLIDVEGRMKIITAEAYLEDLKLPEELRLYSAEKFPYAFQAGPLVVENGKVNPGLGAWHKNVLNGKRSIIGFDSNGRFFRFDVEAPISFFGKFGKTKKGLQVSVEKWQKDNKIQWAMMTDGGNTGFSLLESAPPYALVFMMKDFFSSAEGRKIAEEMGQQGLVEQLMNFAVDHRNALLMMMVVGALLSAMGAYFSHSQGKKKKQKETIGLGRERQRENLNRIAQEEVKRRQSLGLSDRRNISRNQRRSEMRVADGGITAIKDSERAKKEFEDAVSKGELIPQQANTSGANEAVIYEGSRGKWYAKKYQNPDQARVELLSWLIYRQLDIPVAQEMFVSEINGDVVLVSKMMPGDAAWDGYEDPALAALEFVASAFTQDRDRSKPDNYRKHQGRIYALDFGSSAMFRSNGEIKGEGEDQGAFSFSAENFLDMLSMNSQHHSKNFFRKLNQDQISRQIDFAAERLTDDVLNQMINAAFTESSLVKKEIFDVYKESVDELKKLASVFEFAEEESAPPVIAEEAKPSAMQQILVSLRDAWVNFIRLFSHRKANHGDLHRFSAESKLDRVVPVLGALLTRQDAAELISQKILEVNRFGEPKLTINPLQLAKWDEMPWYHGFDEAKLDSETGRPILEEIIFGDNPGLRPSIPLEGGFNRPTVTRDVRTAKNYVGKDGRDVILAFDPVKARGFLTDPFASIMNASAVVEDSYIPPSALTNDSKKYVITRFPDKTSDELAAALGVTKEWVAQVREDNWLGKLNFDNYGLATALRVAAARSEMRVVDQTPEEIADWVVNLSQGPKNKTEEWSAAGFPGPFSNYPLFMREFPVERFHAVLSVLRARKEYDAGKWFAKSMLDSLLGYGMQNTEFLADLPQYYDYFNLNDANTESEFNKNLDFFERRTAAVQYGVSTALKEQVLKLAFGAFGVRRDPNEEYEMEPKFNAEGHSFRNQFVRDLNLAFMIALESAGEKGILWDPALMPFLLQLSNSNSVMKIRNEGFVGELDVTIQVSSQKSKLTVERNKNEVSIGRGSSNDLNVQDASVSRSHIVLRRDADNSEKFRLVFTGKNRPLLWPDAERTSRSEARASNQIDLVSVLISEINAGRGKLKQLNVYRPLLEKIAELEAGDNDLWSAAAMSGIFTALQEIEINGSGKSPNSAYDSKFRELLNRHLAEMNLWLSPRGYVLTVNPDNNLELKPRSEARTVSLDWQKTFGVDLPDQKIFSEYRELIAKKSRLTDAQVDRLKELAGDILRSLGIRFEMLGGGIIEITSMADSQNYFSNTMSRMLQNLEGLKNIQGEPVKVHINLFAEKNQAEQYNPDSHLIPISGESLASPEMIFEKLLLVFRHETIHAQNWTNFSRGQAIMPAIIGQSSGSQDYTYDDEPIAYLENVFHEFEIVLAEFARAVETRPSNEQIFEWIVNRVNLLRFQGSTGPGRLAVEIPRTKYNLGQILKIFEEGEKQVKADPRRLSLQAEERGSELLEGTRKYLVLKTNQIRKGTFSAAFLPFNIRGKIYLSVILPLERTTVEFFVPGEMFSSDLISQIQAELDSPQTGSDLAETLFGFLQKSILPVLAERREVVQSIQTEFEALALFDEKNIFPTMNEIYQNTASSSDPLYAWTRLKSLEPAFLKFSEILNQLKKYSQGPVDVQFSGVGRLDTRSEVETQDGTRSELRTEQLEVFLTAVEKITGKTRAEITKMKTKDVGEITIAEAFERLQIIAGEWAEGSSYEVLVVADEDGNFLQLVLTDDQGNELPELPVFNAAYETLIMDMLDHLRNQIKSQTARMEEEWALSPVLESPGADDYDDPRSVELTRAAEDPAALFQVAINLLQVPYLDEVKNEAIELMRRHIGMQGGNQEQALQVYEQFMLLAAQMIRSGAISSDDFITAIGTQTDFTLEQEALFADLILGYDSRDSYGRFLDVYKRELIAELTTLRGQPIEVVIEKMRDSKFLNAATYALKWVAEEIIQEGLGEDNNEKIEAIYNLAVSRRATVMEKYSQHAARSESRSAEEDRYLRSGKYAANLLRSWGASAQEGGQNLRISNGSLYRLIYNSELSPWQLLVFESAAEFKKGSEAGSISLLPFKTSEDKGFSFSDDALVLEIGRSLEAEHQGQGIMTTALEQVRLEIDQFARDKGEPLPIIVTDIIHLPTVMNAAYAVPVEWIASKNYPHFLKSRDEWEKQVVNWQPGKTGERENGIFAQNGAVVQLRSYSGGMDWRHVIESNPSIGRQVSNIQQDARDITVNYLLDESVAETEKEKIRAVLRQSAIMKSYTSAGFGIPEIVPSAPNEARKGFKLYFVFSRDTARSEARAVERFDGFVNQETWKAMASWPIVLGNQIPVMGFNDFYEVQLIDPSNKPAVFLGADKQPLKFVLKIYQDGEGTHKLREATEVGIYEKIMQAAIDQPIDGLPGSWIHLPAGLMGGVFRGSDIYEVGSAEGYQAAAKKGLLMVWVPGIDMEDLLMSETWIESYRKMEIPNQIPNPNFNFAANPRSAYKSLASALVEALYRFHKVTGSVHGDIKLDAFKVKYLDESAGILDINPETGEIAVKLIDYDAAADNRGSLANIKPQEVLGTWAFVSHRQVGLTSVGAQDFRILAPNFFDDYVSVALMLAFLWMDPADVKKFLQPNQDLGETELSSKYHKRILGKDTRLEFIREHGGLEGNPLKDWILDVLNLKPQLAQAGYSLDDVVQSYFNEVSTRSETRKMPTATWKREKAQWVNGLTETTFLGEADEYTFTNTEAAEVKSKTTDLRALIAIAQNQKNEEVLKLLNYPSFVLFFLGLKPSYLSTIKIDVREPSVTPLKNLAASDGEVERILREQKIDFYAPNAFVYRAQNLAEALFGAKDWLSENQMITDSEKKAIEIYASSKKIDVEFHAFLVPEFFRTQSLDETEEFRRQDAIKGVFLGVPLEAVQSFDAFVRGDEVDVVGVEPEKMGEIDLEDIAFAAKRTDGKVSDAVNKHMARYYDALSYFYSRSEVRDSDEKGSLDSRFADRGPLDAELVSVGEYRIFNAMQTEMVNQLPHLAGSMGFGLRVYRTLNAPDGKTIYYFVENAGSLGLAAKNGEISPGMDYAADGFTPRRIQIQSKRIDSEWMFVEEIAGKLRGIRFPFSLRGQGYTKQILQAYFNVSGATQTHPEIRNMLLLRSLLNETFNLKGQNFKFEVDPAAGGEIIPVHVFWGKKGETHRAIVLQKDRERFLSRRGTDIIQVSGGALFKIEYADSLPENTQDYQMIPLNASLVLRPAAEVKPVVLVDATKQTPDQPARSEARDQEIAEALEQRITTDVAAIQSQLGVKAADWMAHSEADARSYLRGIFSEAPLSAYERKLYSFFTEGAGINMGLFFTLNGPWNNANYRSSNLNDWYAFFSPHEIHARVGARGIMRHELAHLWDHYQRGDHQRKLYERRNFSFESISYEMVANLFASNGNLNVAYDITKRKYLGDFNFFSSRLIQLAKVRNSGLVARIDALPESLYVTVAAELVTREMLSILDDLDQAWQVERFAQIYNPSDKVFKDAVDAAEAIVRNDGYGRGDYFFDLLSESVSTEFLPYASQKVEIDSRRSESRVSTASSGERIEGSFKIENVTAVDLALENKAFQAAVAILAGGIVALATGSAVAGVLAALTVVAGFMAPASDKVTNAVRDIMKRVDFESNEQMVIVQVRDELPDESEMQVFEQAMQANPSANYGMIFSSKLSLAEFEGWLSKFENKFGARFSASHAATDAKLNQNINKFRGSVKDANILISAPSRLAVDSFLDGIMDDAVVFTPDSADFTEKRAVSLANFRAAAKGMEVLGQERAVSIEKQGVRTIYKYSGQYLRSAAQVASEIIQTLFAVGRSA